MKDVKSSQIGFFQILETDSDSSQARISDQNIVVVGGLDKFGTLNQLESFDVDKTAIVFAESSSKDSSNDFLEISDTIVLGPDWYDAILSSLPDKYLVAPFDVTNNHNPSRFWSKSGTSDPLHGPFHPYLTERGISNWDFDFGRGVVITWSQDTLRVPFSVESNAKFSIFIRLLTSPAGGAVGIAFDDEEKTHIQTFTDQSAFKWIELESKTFAAGSHSIAIDNVLGLNAINVIAVIPEDSLEGIRGNLSDYINRATNIHLVEGESVLKPDGLKVGNTLALLIT
jgi:hypothetical protein